MPKIMATWAAEVRHMFTSSNLRIDHAGVTFGPRVPIRPSGCTHWG
jgi:hypothetical protein